MIAIVKIDASQPKKAAQEATAASQKVKKTIQVSAEDQERIARSTEQRAKEREARQEKQRKQRERDRKKELENRKNQAEEYGDKIKGVARSLSGAFLGFETLKGAIGLFNNITTATAALGRKSENLGVAAKDLQTWELAVKKAGGVSEDADKTFSTLSQTFTGALLQGKSSPFLELLNSMGVAAKDAKLQIKPLGDVLLELGEHMQARGLSRANAFNMFTAAGGSEGVFNLLYDPRHTQFLAESRQAANKDQQKIADSQKFQANVARVKENIGAVLSDVQGAAVHALNTASIRPFKRGSREQVEFDRRRFAPTVSATEAKYGLPAGLLDRMLTQESKYDENAKSKAGALGVAQLMPKSFPGAGVDPYADIDTGGKEIARLLKAYHGDVGLATAAYNAGQGNIDSILKTGLNTHGKPLLDETKKYTRNVAGATPSVLTSATTHPELASDHSVNVTTGPVTINTAATDANGIAADFMGAMKSKGSLVAQTNYGVTP
jgi:membrane-bound lytic murein transglycosylase B